MIISSIKGRLRYRAPWLKQASFQQSFKERLQQEIAITQIETNVKTGSILVGYDRHYLAQADLEALIIEIALELVATADIKDSPMHGRIVVDKISKRSKRRKPGKNISKRWLKKQVAGVSVNQIIKFGMLGTLIPSMVWAAAGSKKLHILSGYGFLVFVGMHMYSYRERLLK